MTPVVYINDIAGFLPNEPIGNDAIEHVLGMVGGKPSRSKKIVLRNNGIKTRYYAIDPQTGKYTHNNAQMTAEVSCPSVRKTPILVKLNLLSKINHHL